MAEQEDTTIEVASEEDVPLALGHEDYAQALFRRIKRHLRDPSPAGEPALVVGLYGEWGCGKTMWLNRIKALFEKSLEDPEAESITVPIFFNAWRFEKEEYLIVPLLKSAQEQLKKYEEREGFGNWLKDRASALRAAVVAVAQGLSGKLSVPLVGELAWEAGGIAAGAIEASEELQQAKADAIDDYASIYFGLISFLQSITGREIRREDQRLPKRILEKFIPTRDPNKKKSGGETQWKKLNLVFLIDDLDRCLPEKAVEMLEAIKLFLEVEGCAFVLGLDDVIVDRGITHRYKDYLFESHRSGVVSNGDGEELVPPISGMEYLEKIIHLPVRVPAMTPNEARKFLLSRFEYVFTQDRSADTAERIFANPQVKDDALPIERVPNEALLKVFLDHVPLVPRKFVRAVELFELQREIAKKRPGLRLRDGILARLIFLQLFAPDLFRFGRQRPEFLATMGGWRSDSVAWQVASVWTRTLDEQLKKATDPSNGDPKEVIKIEHYDRPLRRHLERCRKNRSGFDPYEILPPADAGVEFDELDPDRLKRYFSLLSYEVGSAEVSEPVPIPARLDSGKLVAALPDGLMQELLEAFNKDDRGIWGKAVGDSRNALGNFYIDPTGFAKIAELAKARAGDFVEGESLGFEWLAAIVDLILPEQHRGELVEHAGKAQWRDDMFRRAFTYQPGEVSGLERHDAAVIYDRVIGRSGTGATPWGDPEIEWVPIEPGYYPNGSSDNEGEDSEGPAHWVEIGSLGVSRYPVTVSQFAAFVAGGGYESGAEWWGETDVPDPVELGEKYSASTLPRTSVSWDEACAYSRWLSQRTGEEVRLPTEAEWEAIARLDERREGKGGPNPMTGPDGWGEHAISDRINMGDSGIGGPSVVGAFPGGSIGDVDDLLGNVWEWCSTVPMEYSDPQKPVWPDSYRALRGGSWGYDARGCRPASRRANHPDARNAGIGFRLVRVLGKAGPQGDQDK